MRIIKFRTWNKIEKTMGVCGMGIWGGDLNYNKNYIPMQFTGLKDKNGKEIYEGDILIPVEMHDSNIAWWSNGKGFPIKVEWTKFGWDMPYDFENWEVAGNIYENPELLQPTPREG